MGLVRAAFKPEFLNRLDEVVIFDALGRDELAHIVDLQVRAFAARLADRRIALEVTDAAREWLARTGLRPGLRRPPAAPARPARDRRPAGPGAARGRGPRRRDGHGRPRRLGGHADPHLLIEASFGGVGRARKVCFRSRGCSQLAGG